MDRATLLQRTATAERVVVGLLLAALLSSFLYGWYGDGSTPPAGLGWADQNLYTLVANHLASFQLPPAGAFHYQMGYPLMGALGHQVVPSDPFMPVSLGLLLASATFGYLAVRSLLAWPFAALFLVSLFAWDLVGRSFTFASELFVVPWNNQVIFFAVCFYFWVIAARVAKGSPMTVPLAVAVGGVAGVSIMTREEMALFIVPLVAFILYRSKASPMLWALTGGVMVVAYLPHLLLKWAAVGDVASTARRRGYLQVLGDYIDPLRLGRNLVDVVFDSSLRGLAARRPAILQAAPWLWLAPIGLVMYLVSRAESLAVKVFLVWSGVVFLFYLGGENVSHHKMQFHCIRYLTPGFPALHFGVVYTLSRAWDWSARWRDGQPVETPSAPSLTSD